VGASLDSLSDQLEALAQSVARDAEVTRKNQAGLARSIDRLANSQELSVREMRSALLRLAAIEADVRSLSVRVGHLEGPIGQFSADRSSPLPALSTLGEESPSGTWHIPKGSALRYERLRDDARSWRTMRKGWFLVVVAVASLIACMGVVLAGLALYDSARRHPSVITEGVRP
jgi:hypothetical protein